MESGEHQDRWPIIGQADVADVCQSMCSALLELERAFEAGELTSKLTSSDFEAVLGPQVFGTYGRLGGTAPGPLHHLRIGAVDALLAQLRNDLLPTRVAHARIRIADEISAPAPEPDGDLRRRPTFKFVDASFDGAPKAVLRLDQMLDVRFWRIGFTFETSDLGDAFARIIVRGVSRRLAGDLLDLQQILRDFNPDAPKPELRIIPYPENKRFEHLILDILNEEARHARIAPLDEDFLEKTDIRVTYPALERKRGGRLQVTSITEPELHKTKVERIRRVEEYIFLSPLSLAQFVDALRGKAAASAGSDPPPFALAALWDCLDAKPADVPQLASELKRVLFAALAATPDSPLGPMARVPPVLRQLIRYFVETRAVASTGKLREREERDPRKRASQEKRADDAYKKERSAERLHALSAGSSVLGRVSNIVDYGAFIDLGGIDGLLHVSAIPGAVNGTIGQKLRKGDEIEVEIFTVDIEKQHVSLRLPRDGAGGE